MQQFLSYLCVIVILIKLIMLCIKISSYSKVQPKRSKDIRYETKSEELTQTEHITGSYNKCVRISRY